MKSKKIIAAIIIGVVIISSIEFTKAQDAVDKAHLRYQVKHVTEYAREISKYAKSQLKHSEKGNLNEFVGDTNIVLEYWMLNPEAWNNSNIDNATDEVIALKDWMLKPEIMGNKIEEFNESKDQIIGLEDWMLSPEMMAGKGNVQPDNDEKIELFDWMLYLADFKKIK